MILDFSYNWLMGGSSFAPKNMCDCNKKLFFYFWWRKFIVEIFLIPSYHFSSMNNDLILEEIDSITKPLHGQRLLIESKLFFIIHVVSNIRKKPREEALHPLCGETIKKGSLANMHSSKILWDWASFFSFDLSIVFYLQRISIANFSTLRSLVRFFVTCILKATF